MICVLSIDQIEEQTDDNRLREINYEIKALQMKILEHYDRINTLSEESSRIKKQKNQMHNEYYTDNPKKKMRKKTPRKFRRHNSRDASSNLEAETFDCCKIFDAYTLDNLRGNYARGKIIFYECKNSMRAAFEECLACNYNSDFVITSKMLQSQTERLFNQICKFNDCFKMTTYLNSSSQENDVHLHIFVHEYHHKLMMEWVITTIYMVRFDKRTFDNVYNLLCAMYRRATPAQQTLLKFFKQIFTFAQHQQIDAMPCIDYDIFCSKDGLDVILDFYGLLYELVINMERSRIQKQHEPVSSSINITLLNEQLFISTDRLKYHMLGVLDYLRAWLIAGDGVSERAFVKIKYLSACEQEWNNYKMAVDVARIVHDISWQCIRESKSMTVHIPYCYMNHGDWNMMKGRLFVFGIAFKPVQIVRYNVSVSSKNKSANVLTRTDCLMF